MPTYKCLSLEEFKSVLGDGNKKVAVIFYVTFCGYSKHMLSLFRELAERAVYNKSYDLFVEVDCDEQPDIQHYYGIDMLPHIMVFRDQEMVGEVIGKQIFNKALPAMLSRHM